MLQAPPAPGLHTMTVAGGVNDVKTAVEQASSKPSPTLAIWRATSSGRYESVVDTAKNFEETGKDMHKNGNKASKALWLLLMGSLTKTTSPNLENIRDHADDFADDQENIIDNTADKVRDAAVDTVKELVDIVEDCFSSADDLATAGPQPALGHTVRVHPQETRGLFRGAGRDRWHVRSSLPKIADGVLEVGEALIDLATDFGQRVHADCKSSKWASRMSLPSRGVDFKKRLHSLRSTASLEGCLELKTLAKDLSKSLLGVLSHTSAPWCPKSLPFGRMDRSVTRPHAILTTISRTQPG